MGHRNQPHTGHIDLLLIGDDKELDTSLRGLLEKNGIRGALRRLAPGTAATRYVRRFGNDQERDAPRLVFFDFSSPNDANTAVLRDIAFGKQRTRIPLIVLTTASSQHLLHAKNISDHRAVMFSPTPLCSFAKKMRDEKRSAFLKAVATLYEYGPILVQLPDRRSGQHDRGDSRDSRVAYAGGHVSCA